MRKNKFDAKCMKNFFKISFLSQICKKYFLHKEIFMSTNDETQKLAIFGP
jgi:hypothetical protein